jgi:hypothetical protein
MIVLILGCAGVGTYVFTSKTINNTPDAIRSTQSTLVYTETWTAECMSERGQTCKGTPTIFIKPGFTYCNHGDKMYNVSTFGYKEFHISNVAENYVQWYIRTVGQNDGGTATIAADIWVKGIAADATPEERSENGCK